MNQKKARVVVGAIALVFGGAAIIGMKSILNKPAVVVKTKAVNTVNVLVARSNISLGDVVKEGSFRWLAWPRDALGPLYVRQDRRRNAAKDFSGSIARAQIMAGEPISARKLIKAGQGGVPANWLRLWVAPFHYQGQPVILAQSGLSKHQDRWPFEELLCQTLFL